MNRIIYFNGHPLYSRQQNEDFEIKSIETRGKDEIDSLTENFNKIGRTPQQHLPETRKRNRRAAASAEKALLESEEKYRKMQHTGQADEDSGLFPGFAGK